MGSIGKLTSGSGATTGGGAPISNPIAGANPFNSGITNGWNNGLQGGSIEPVGKLLVGAAGNPTQPTPSGAPIQQTVTPEQVTAAKNSVSDTRQDQQSLLSALNGQNALQSQSNVLGQQQGLNQSVQALNGAGVMQGAIQGQQSLSNQLGNTNGVGLQTSAGVSAQNLASQLGSANGVNTQQQAIQGLQGAAAGYQNLANGVGANPAQAALNQNTAQNIQNQAALMASQRGAGANIGMLARQAGMQGANTQQQAVGQAATMQANQQLAGLQGQITAQQAIGGLGTTQVGQQQAALGQQAGIGAGLVGQQQAALQNQFNAGSNVVGLNQTGITQAGNLANTMAGQQIGQTNANAQGALSNQGQVFGAQQGQNQEAVGMQSNINTGNTSLNQISMQGQQGLMGGLMNAGGSALGSYMKAEGGEIKRFAGGGDTIPTPQPILGATTPAAISPKSEFGQWLQYKSTQPGGVMGTGGYGENSGAKALQEGASNLGSGLINALGGIGGGGSSLSNMGGWAGADAGATTGLGEGAGTMYASLGEGAVEAAPEIAEGAAVAAANGGSVKQLANQGGGVKAANTKQKAVKDGNSYDNDKIPAMLSEGEVVIPRSVMQSGDPIRGSVDFVAKIIAKRKAGK